jgi:hypothetical protein
MEDAVATTEIYIIGMLKFRLTVSKDRRASTVKLIVHHSVILFNMAV